MYRRGIVVLLACVIFVCCLYGCSAQQETTKPANPAGVFESSGSVYYVVKIPDGKKVTDYFQFRGAENTVVVSSTNGSSYFEHIGAIYYREVLGGGWVAYTESQTGRFLFVPAGVSKDKVQRISSSLTSNIAGNGSCMAIEEAKKYIPSLGK